ncbi:MAG: cupin domain-containing protein [Candidatus Binatia bacterium]
MAGAFRSDPGKGERIQLLGGQISIIRARGQHTGGAYSFMETRTPKAGGPPPHVHEREDETFFVLEGEYAITVGEETFEAKPGSLVFAPRGIPHTYVATGERCRHITLITPPGFESFFADSSEAAIAGPTAVAAVAERYGVTMLGESNTGEST